jgi:hypothetical protein
MFHFSWCNITIDHQPPLAAKCGLVELNFKQFFSRLIPAQKKKITRANTNPYDTKANAAG